MDEGMTSISHSHPYPHPHSHPHPNPTPTKFCAHSFKKTEIAEKTEIILDQRQTTLTTLEEHFCRHEFFGELCTENIQ